MRTRPVFFCQTVFYKKNSHATPSYRIWIEIFVSVGKKKNFLQDALELDCMDNRKPRNHTSGGNWTRSNPYYCVFLFSKIKFIEIGYTMRDVSVYSVPIMLVFEQNKLMQIYIIIICSINTMVMR